MSTVFIAKQNKYFPRKNHLVVKLVFLQLLLQNSETYCKKLLPDTEHAAGLISFCNRLQRLSRLIMNVPGICTTPYIVIMIYA